MDLEFFADDDEVERLEAQLTAAGEARTVALLLPVAWQMRQRDPRRSLTLCDEAERTLRVGGLTGTEPTRTTARLQLCRAEVHWLHGSLDLAQPLLDAALANFSALGDAVGMGDAEWLATWVSLGRGDRQQLSAGLGRAQDHFALAGDPLRLAATQARIVFHEAFADPMAARVRWLALSTTQLPTHPLVQAWALAAEGVIESQSGHRSAAARAYLHGFDAMCRCGNLVQAINCAGNAGVACINLNDLSSALDWNGRALALARQIGNPVQIAAGCVNIAEALRRLKRLEEAQTRLQEAREALAHLPGHPYHINLFGELAALALALGDDAAALNWALQYEARAIAAQRREGQTVALRHQARALGRLGRPDEALLKAGASLVLGQETGNTSWQMEALRVMAELHRQHSLPAPADMRGPNAALHYVEEALTLSRSIEGFLVPPELLDEAAADYAALGDTARAYALSCAARQAQVQMHTREATDRAISMQLSHEAEKARNEASHHRQLALAHAQRAENLLNANTTLEHLGKIGREITRKLDADATFRALDQYVHALLDAPTFAIFRLAPDGMTLKMAFGVEAGRPLDPVELRLDDPVSQNARCARLRQEIVLDFAEEHGSPIAGTLKTQSVMFSPLIVDERLLGVMTIQSQQPHAYGEREVAIFRTLCAYGAIALANGEAQTQLIAAHAKLAATHSELEKQTQKLQEVNEQRSRFLSMTSHEFRTPLATILSSAQLLMHYGARLPPADQIEVTTLIENAVKRMTEMLDKVLTIGRAEGGMLDFKPVPLNLRALCQDIVEQVKLQCPKSPCDIAITFDMDETHGLFDEKLVRHIFDNLLSNAVKYSPDGGNVRFTVRKAGAHTVFTVADEGIGVPPEDLATLFDTFQRASNVGAIPGTGLGLAIAKNSVALHGGSISVASQLGQGTCFEVRL